MLVSWSNTDDVCLSDCCLACMDRWRRNFEFWFKFTLQVTSLLCIQPSFESLLVVHVMTVFLHTFFLQWTHLLFPFSTRLCNNWYLIPTSFSFEIAQVVANLTTQVCCLLFSSQQSSTSFSWLLEILLTLQFKKGESNLLVQQSGKVA